MDIFFVLVNRYFISIMLGYQQENKIQLKYSYKYCHHCARHHIMGLGLWCVTHHEVRIMVCNASWDYDYGV
jgi:hypothetical protein